MLGYLIRRLLLMIPTLIGVTMVVFLVMAYAPGGFADMAEDDAGAMNVDQNARRQARIMARRYGVDQPVPVQYLRWLNQVSPVRFAMSDKLNWPGRHAQRDGRDAGSLARMCGPAHAGTDGKAGIADGRISGSGARRDGHRLGAVDAKPGRRRGVDMVRHAGCGAGKPRRLARERQQHGRRSTGAGSAHPAARAGHRS